MYKLWVIGIGPGHEDYILPIAKMKAKEADLVFGGQRHLDAFEIDGQKQSFKVPLVDNLLLMKKALETQQVAVLLSGDTGFYSMLTMIKTVFKPDQLVTFPGISALSYMYARLNLSYEKALLTSAHGRDLKDFCLASYESIGFLTDSNHDPKWLQEKFSHVQGKIHIGMDLSYGHEQVMTYKMTDDLPDFKAKLCVVVIEIEQD